MDRAPQVPFPSPESWLPDQRPPTGTRAALHRLATAMRRNIHLLTETEADEAELIAAAEALERLNAQLAQRPRPHRLWGFAETSNAGDPHAFFDYSPVVGQANPLAPPLQLRLEDGVVRGSGTFGNAYEGPPGHVHGGFIAAAFDEVLGLAQSTTGRPGMTGTLTVRYRHPTPLNRELRFEGRVERVEGRKIFTRGTLHAGDVLCAEAEAVFVSVDFERMVRLAAGQEPHRDA
ncbi:MAG TPA: PaaI family thioesterase [Dehalococcoidia bacterium]